MGELRRHLKSPATFKYADALETCKRARRIRAAQTWLDGQRQSLTIELGPHYLDALTPWASVQSALETVGAISAWFDNRQPPSTLVDLLQNGRHLPSVRSLAAALDAARRLW